jgi:Ring finger domain
MPVSTVDLALLATGAGLWLLILIILVCGGARLVRRAKRLATAQAAAEADAAAVAAAFAAAMGMPAPPAPAATPRGGVRRRLRNARALLAEAAALVPSTPADSLPAGSGSGGGGGAGGTRAPEVAGLSLAQIDEAAPCMLSPAATAGADGADSGVICSICLDEVEGSSPQRALPCGHAFHPDCIQLWLPRANRCPQCQAEVVATPKPGREPARALTTAATAAASRRSRREGTFWRRLPSDSVPAWAPSPSDESLAALPEQLESSAIDSPAGTGGHFVDPITLVPAAPYNPAIPRDQPSIS